MTTNYRRGADFERKVRDHLMSKDVGAAYVMRAAGSHTLADLAAFFPAGGVSRGLLTDVWLVQCKRDGLLSREERELLVSLCREIGARPMLANAGPRGVPVLLIDVGYEQ